MKIRVNAANPGLTGQEELVLENGLGSPSSGDESKLAGEPSSKKSRRDVQRRVVSVPIGDVEGSKSKAETYPPSDSWAWRKYGQKPIKGSPYPSDIEFRRSFNFAGVKLLVVSAEKCRG